MNLGTDLRRHIRHGKTDQGYIEYQRLFAAQEELRELDCGATIISEAFTRLPKLNSIVTAICYGQPIASPQLRSLLAGSNHAEKQLTKLIIGDVSWRFLQDRAENMNMMKQSLRHLRTLSLKLSTGYDPATDQLGAEIPECRNYFANNALVDFIRAAPRLESLSIRFDWDTVEYATELKHVVHDHTWSNLRSVVFEKIDITQQDFASFLGRHASTLQSLGLSAIRLLDQGGWVPTLMNVQKTLSLRSATIREGLYCDDPPQCWPLDGNVCAYDGGDDDDAQRKSTSEALSYYLVHGGSCPLLDEENHPNAEAK